MGSALFGSTAQFSNVLEFEDFTAAKTKTPQADSTCEANFASHNRSHENRSAALIYIKFRMGNALHKLLPDIEDPADCTSASKHLQWRRDFNERSGRHLMSPLAPRVTWCDAAICPKLGLDRKCPAHARNDVDDP